MAKPSADPTQRFFTELAAREHEPLLRNASGSTRLEVLDGRRTRRWTVRIEHGDIVVVPTGNEPVDCVIRADKALFDKIARGRENAVAAVLRGDLEVEGDWRLLVRMQRLFPGPRRVRR